MANLQQLETALRNADAAGDADAAKILAGEITKLRAESYKPEPASAWKRAAYGVAEPIVGLAQLTSRGLAAAGSVLPEGAVRDYLQELPARNDQAAAEFAAKQREMAPEGVDWARLGGNVLTLAPTVVAGGPVTGAAALAGRGAVQGAVAGATGIVEDPQNYGVTKGLQVGGGAVLGGVAAPVADKVIKAGASAVQGLRGLLKPAMTPQEINIQITQALQRDGVNLADLPPNYLQELTSQVQGALKAGGTLNENALANMAAAKSLGIDLTRGQATQEPVQYGTELFLRNAPGGEQLAGQYVNSLTRLNQNLTDLGARLPSPTLDVSLGRQAITALKAADAPRREQVGALYDAAKNTAGIDTPLDGRAFVDKTLTQLEKNLSLSDVPADIKGMLNMVSQGQGTLTVGRAQEVVQAINARLANLPHRDPQRIALNLIKTNLDEAVDNAGANLPGQAGEAFRQARAAAAARFKLIEKVPALREALDGDAVPDDFVRKHVYGSNIDDFKALRAYLRSHNKPVWEQIRAQVLSDLKSAASRGNDSPEAFSQAAYNKALNGLREDGRLGLMFGPSEIAKLTQVGKVGRLVQEGPPGVSRTGMGGAAKASGMFMNALARMIPGTPGAVVRELGNKGTNALQAQVALVPPPVASVPPMLPREVQNRLALIAAGLPPLGLQ